MTAPRNYVWLIEDEPITGTLDDFARTLEESHYSGIHVSQARRIDVDDDTYLPILTSPSIQQERWAGDDYLFVTLTDLDNGRVARYQIDLRA